MSLLTERRWILATILLVVAYCVPAAAQEQRRGFYTPPASDAIHAVVAEHGMVVAQEKIAARLGADVLRRGGNAVDAAVATGFALAVTYPRAGNIGGGGFMIIHSAERHADVAVDYRESAPAAMTRDSFLGSDGKPDSAKSRDSALGIGVPGTVAGLTLALEQYGSGKFTLADLLKPAIDLARDAPCRTGIGGWRAGRPRQKSFRAPTARRCAKATCLFKPIWRQHSRQSQHRGRGDFTKVRSRRNWPPQFVTPAAL